MSTFFQESLGAHILKVSVVSLVVAITTVTPARAQTPSGAVSGQGFARTQRDLAAPLSGRTPFQIRRPMPVQACLATLPHFAGSRTCFGAGEYISLAPGAGGNSTASFFIPYGYQISFFDNATVPGAQNSNLRFLCEYQQRSTERFTSGASLSNGLARPDNNGPFGYKTCLGPFQRENLATIVTFRKIPDISDAQRTAVWANWETNDNDFCAVNIFYWSSLVDHPIAPNRPNPSDRSKCFGTKTDLSDLTRHTFRAVPSGIEGNLKTHFGTVEIASRYVSITFFERINQTGRSLTLGCGRYSVSGALVGQLSSARIDVSPQPATTCATQSETKSAWDPSLRVFDSPTIPIIPRS